MGEEVNILCPFCGEEGFDLVGLKDHLIRYCDVFSTTISLEQESILRQKEALREIIDVNDIID